MKELARGPHVVLSVLEPSVEHAARRVAAAPDGIGLIEVRADHLGAAETASLVRSLDRPVIVTVRCERDGGGFRGSEEDRQAILRTALAAGARYVDVEWRGPLQELAEDPALAGRVILSDHEAECRSEDLEARYRSMSRSAAAILKIVPRCESPADGSSVRDLLRLATQDDRRLICFARDRAGALTRLLAPAWGSWATYGAATRGGETAAGQFLARDLVEVHDVCAIGPRTRRFALVGSAVFGSPSPAMHSACYRSADLDARYMPVEVDDLERFHALVREKETWGIEAFAVTIPFKELAARRCVSLDDCSRAAGAVNTVLVADDEWHGCNTDGPAISSLIGERLDPKGLDIAILGAGGTARTAAAVLRNSGARVVIFNRNTDRARDVADALRVEWAPPARLDDTPWKILVHATPRGAGGERFLAPERLRGRLVLDAVYREQGTALVRDARERGLDAITGFDLLVEQARLQLERMTGIRSDRSVMAAAGMQWMMRSGA